MAITVRLVLRKDKEDSNGLCPICICVTQNRRRTYHATGQKVAIAQWDAASSKVKGHTNAVLLNAKLSKELSELERGIITLSLNKQPITPLMLKNMLRGDEGTDSFIRYAQTVIDAIENNGTSRRYMVELNELQGYAGNVSFGDITPVFLSKYYVFLTTKQKDRAAKEHNTAINAFKFIRLVFNHAIKFGVTTLYPFKRKGSSEGWDYPKYIQPVKGYLTITECDAIWDRIMQDDISDEIRLVGVFFCLECHSGLRVSDWGKFGIERIVGNDELYLRTTKTGVDIRLPLDLMPRLQKVVNYIIGNDLKWTYTGEHANRILKLIAPLCGIKKHLTTHVARHSCATHLLSVGVSMEGVAEVLGVSLKVVQGYAKFSPDKIRNELERVSGL